MLPKKFKFKFLLKIQNVGTFSAVDKLELATVRLACYILLLLLYLISLPSQGN